MYAMIKTRPDLAFSISKLSQYLSNPQDIHWNAIKQVLQYLRGLLNDGITYQARNNQPHLIRYTNSNWASDKDTRRLTGGYIFFLGGAPISWQSKQQATVAFSSYEAKYMATMQAIKEAIWLQKLLKELDGTIHCDVPTKIWSDNQGSIALAINLTGHSKSKHIDIQYHFIQEQLAQTVIVLSYVSTNNMAADGLTKVLSKNLFRSFKDLMGLELI